MKILVVSKAVIRDWLRTRSGLLFSFAFPVILFLVLGSVYGNPGSPAQAVGQNSASYYLPGLTAAFIMANAVIGLTDVGSELKRNGVLRRLSSTPLTKLEWFLGSILSQAVLALALAAVMLTLGVALFNVSALVNAYSVALLLLGALLFSGVGMSLAGLVKDPEVALGLGNIIAFPMMLLSGTFWPISSMPSSLQTVAQALPLTYFADGLRNSMVYADFTAASIDLLVVAVFAIVLILLGAKLTQWKES
jgi:ABC-2 type transport system permease protein